jgi:hypothetical protein
MKVIFNFRGTGAGNNGGTRTLFKSAIQLSKMGEQVEIWSDSSNQFTWFNLPESVPFIVSKEPSSKNADVIIAAGAGSVTDTIAIGNGAQVWYWVRGIESWNHNQNELILYLNLILYNFWYLIPLL